jgi:transposase
VVDAEGRVLVRRRIPDDAAGYQQLLHLLAEAGDTATEPIPVAIETSRGLLVAFLRATGRRVYAINPLAVSRYRDRHGVAGAKSDHADAVVLAGILRTDQAAHRPLPADSELVQAIAVLARAQQDAVWNRQQLANQLRSLLREFFPAALAAFHRKHVGLTAPQARAVLAAAPTPTQAASLTTAQLRRLLRHAGRQRNPRRLDHAAPGQLPRRPATPAPTGRAGHGPAGPGPAQAAGGRLPGRRRPLAEATVKQFRRHSDYQIITSFPGLGQLTGARVLAELGDDRSRFTDARGVKAYAGAAPVTRASGKRLQVLARKVKNQRLAAVGYVWAFAALTAPARRPRALRPAQARR